MKKLNIIIGCVLALSMVGNFYLAFRWYQATDYEEGFEDGYMYAVFEDGVGYNGIEKNPMFLKHTENHGLEFASCNK